MRLLFLLQDVYQLHTATYAYASASRASGAIGADKMATRSGNRWLATSLEERIIPGSADA